LVNTPAPYPSAVKGNDRRPMEIPAPPTLSAGTRRLLNRQIERALRHCFGADVNLQDTVRQIVADSSTAGVSPHDIRTLIGRAIESHGKRQALDRASIIAGLPTSETLARQVLAWVDEELRRSQPSEHE
jgi:hypothetical protein